VFKQASLQDPTGRPDGCRTGARDDLGLRPFRAPWICSRWSPRLPVHNASRWLPAP